MDQVTRAVQAAVDAATFDLDAGEIDGVDARVRFEHRTLERVSALHRDPRSRQQVLDTVWAVMLLGMDSANEPVRESPGWRTAFVAMRLNERLQGVRDRRYVEQADGTIALASDADLRPEDY